MTAEATIRDIADTARWVAAYRAQESEREDAVFSDPLARRLAGERGFEIVRSLPAARRSGWFVVARTLLIDELILREVAAGVDTVINMGAGFDARPYRLPLPASLRWVEVDQEPLVRAKDALLEGETPRCQLERIALDLSRGDDRRALLARIGSESKRVLVLTEGLLCYLRPEDVRELATDLAAVPSVQRWVFDLISPTVLHGLMLRWGNTLREAQAPLTFGPGEGVAWFEPLGWQPLAARSLVKAAARVNRLPLLLRPAALLPELSGRDVGLLPWSGVCLLGR
jgi:methyltransferase (TIGR00027 family)